MKITPEITAEVLTQKGWKRYDRPPYGEIWCKRFTGFPRCKCNDDKDGIQVVISVSEWQGNISYEIDVTGEKEDGIWAKLSVYSIRESLLEVMDSNVEKLLDAWKLINK